jgi:hypothetical protein
MHFSKGSTLCASLDQDGLDNLKSIKSLEVYQDFWSLSRLLKIVKTFGNCQNFWKLLRLLCCWEYLSLHVLTNCNMLAPTEIVNRCTSIILTKTESSMLRSVKTFVLGQDSRHFHISTLDNIKTKLLTLSRLHRRIKTSF